MAFKLFSILMTVLSFILFQASDASVTECVYTPDDATWVTYCDLNVTLRAQLKEKFDGFPTFIDLFGKLARLIFHDCFGPKENDPSIVAICDGCIDMDNPKHSGLPHEIEKLDKIYTKNANFGGSNWNQKMTRADFWAAAATIAIQEASRVPNASWRMLPNPYPVDTLPYIPFYIGRTDCSSSPDINIENYRQESGTKWVDIKNKTTGITTSTEIVSKSFGEATGGFDDNYDLFQQGFDLKPREYVALLGVHTLGRVKRNNSGFGNYIGKPWVEAWDVLDNEFYNILLDDEEREKKLDWIQHEAEEGGLFEWRDTLRGIDGDTRFVMLNSDMALVKNLDSDGNSAPDASTGECPYKSYGELANRPASRQHVVEFARNNQKWLNEFGAVFDRMIRAGYDNVNRVPRDGKLGVLAEQWYLDQFKSVKVAGSTLCSEHVPFTPDPFGDIGPIKWEGGYAKIITDNLAVTLLAFSDEYPGCVVTIEDNVVKHVNYYYNYTYDGIAKELVINIIACCADVSGAIFAADYIAPTGYQYVGVEAELNGDLFDEEDPNLMLKQIVVFGIVGLVLLLCIIGGMLYYKRYKTKKIELELEANQPISPGKDKKKEKKKKNKASATVDVKTPIIDFNEGGGDNNGNSNSMPMPTDNPYIIPANSSIDQYK